MKKRLLACLVLCSMVFALCGMSAFADEGVAEDEEAVELSDDIYDFQLKINGELYAFPMSYTDFTAMGWEYKYDDTETLSPYRYTIAETFTKGDLKIYGTMYNLGINTVTYAESMVGGISMDKYQLEDAPETVVELPGGIEYGVSTQEDIIAAYGTPSDTYEGSMYVELTYKYDYDQKWTFHVYNESGVLEDFEVRNFIEDEEANAAAAAEVSDEPTEEVLAYVAPEELGDEPLSFVVEYAGDLYQLPAPVSVFLENGWTLKSEYEGSVFAGRIFDVISMMKDNQELRAYIRNYNPDAQVAENCFVTYVRSGVNSCDLPLTIPGGITVGMTNDELLAALEGMDYEVNDSSSYYIYYTIANPDTYGEDIEISVDLETNNVVEIEIDYDPNELPFLAE